MSGQGTKKVLDRDIQLVQNLVEKCIQLHMNRVEAVNALWLQAKIDRHFTELVWQKLEEENQDFFEAYNLRLALKDHISIFNELLRQHVLLKNELQCAGVHSPPDPIGSHPTYFLENSECHESTKQEALDASFSSSLGHLYTNGLSHTNGSLHTAFNLPGPSGRIDSVALSSQDSSLRMIPGMNGGEGATIKPELDDYAFSSQFNFSANDYVLETMQAMGNEHIGFYNALDIHPEASSLDHIALLGPIPQDLSFSDLSANHSGSDLLEGSPFFGTDNFVGCHEDGEIHENNNSKKLSDSLCYDDF
ncbi:hypothetical protein V2J09_018607 [Rumex salicifolius]